MLFQHYAGEGFHIWFSNYLFRQSGWYTGIFEKPVLELHIQLLNELTTNWDRTGNQTLRPYGFNLSFNPFLNNQTSFLRNMEVHTFDIHFSRKFLQPYAKVFPVLDIFLQKADGGKEPADLVERDHRLNNRGIILINQLLRESFRPEVAAFYLDCKVRELLILVLEQVSGISHDGELHSKSAAIDQMFEAKKILLSDFEAKMTIPKLARAVGTNEFKLKKEFKLLHGMSVFECLQNERLEKAKELLERGELSITEIANMTGYDPPSKRNLKYSQIAYSGENEQVEISRLAGPMHSGLSARYIISLLSAPWKDTISYTPHRTRDTRPLF
jgi:AraC-like DNA-binding protein